MTTKKSSTAPGGEGKPQAEPARLINYSPEIEVNREKYLRVGASLRALCKVEHTSVGGGIDIIPPGFGAEEDGHRPKIVYDAIQDHLAALFEDVSSVYGEDFWETLYVELRLYYDERRRAISPDDPGGGSAQVSA